jgi:hypothetical protein
MYLKSILTSSRDTDETLTFNTENTNNQLSLTQLLEKSGVQCTPKMHELYIKLLCQFNPQGKQKYYIINNDNC